MNSKSGLLLVDKARGSTSFRIVSQLRQATKIEKIGHAGTLDPFATGLMVMLVGKEATKRSNSFLECDKEYEAVLHLGISTDSYDIDGAVVARSPHIPSLQNVEQALAAFQGSISQIPPMYSAKKVQGKKLYDLARQGIVIERQPVVVHVETKLLSYEYPELRIHVTCSKGTYIRSLAHDIGGTLRTGAHLSSLIRLRSGPFHLIDAIPQMLIQDPHFDIAQHLRSLP
jgi:tRNA pseudouridine55 synthase